MVRYTPPGGSPASYLNFRHPRALDADGFHFTVGSSLDLTNWSPGALSYVSTLVDTGRVATVTYRSLLPASSLTTSFFVRLKVQP